jgi:hypothetical protein
MLRSGLALLMILLAAPACAGSRAGGGFHGGGFHGGGFHGGGFHGGGFHGGGFHGGGFHGGGAFAFHRSVGRARGLSGVYGYGYGYNCGFGFDCGVYDSGYGYGYGLGYGGGGENAVTSSSGYSGGYVPDPEGADIPPVIFPTPCWVRRAGYDPSGAYVGPVLIDLCRPSDRVTVSRVDARAETPNTGKGTGEPASVDRSGAAQSPP